MLLVDWIIFYWLLLAFCFDKICFYKICFGKIFYLGKISQSLIVLKLSDPFIIYIHYL